MELQKKLIANKRDLNEVTAKLKYTLGMMKAGEVLLSYFRMVLVFLLICALICSFSHLISFDNCLVS